MGTQWVLGSIRKIRKIAWNNRKWLGVSFELIPHSEQFSEYQWENFFLSTKLKIIWNWIHFLFAYIFRMAE